MTISTTTSRISYSGNGVTTVFAFPYRFLENADLTVVLVSSAGVETTKMLTTDYTVTGADEDAGGTVTMLVAPASGERLVILREMDLTQETDYISGDPFPAESHERALDRLTMISQQIQEQVDRSLTIPLDDAGFSGQLPPIVASRYLRTNAAGDGLDLVDIVTPGTLVVSPYIETLLDAADEVEARTILNAQEDGVSALSGDVTASGLTMSTDRALLRTTAGAGAVEEKSAAQFLTWLGISVSLTPLGMVAPFARTTAPSGWLALPLTATNISRTTYANLFAVIGTTWGAGDGSTTFGCPYLPENYTPVQANANVGTSTVGQVIAHTHTYGAAASPHAASGANANINSGSAFNTGSTGGSANLAAGVRFLWCVYTGVP